MLRHIGFAELQDFRDIQKFDWPRVREGLQKNLFAEDEPLPVSVADLGTLVAAKQKGPIITELNWSKLDDKAFERLLFMLISSEAGYENPQWLMQTRAADRGRDLSVFRVLEDSLAGVIRQRVIIQCKHWQSRSLAISDIAALKEQMALLTCLPNR